MSDEERPLDRKKRRRPRTDLPAARLLRFADVRALIDPSADERTLRLRLWRQCRAGEFPTPVKIGRSAIAWRSEELEGWLASRPRAVAPAGEAA
jgi:predicted DNA-binding transcriptional regulator AlpA